MRRKTELRLAFPIHPYVSLRFIGDERGAVRLGHQCFTSESLRTQRDRGPGVSEFHVAVA